MRYPIAIEPGDATHAFGVVVPDLPGCYSAGDSLDEAITNAEEAVLLWIDQAMDEGRPIPTAGNVEQHRDNPDFAGWIWAVVNVDISRMDKAQRINITLPARVLTAIDNAARREGETRSGMLARAALYYAARPKDKIAGKATAIRKKKSARGVKRKSA
jgi:predicted RNase H-like HicB family nuclease